MGAHSRRAMKSCHSPKGSPITQIRDHMQGGETRERGSGKQHSICAQNAHPAFRGRALAARSSPREAPARRRPARRRPARRRPARRRPALVHKRSRRGFENENANAKRYPPSPGRVRAPMHFDQAASTSPSSRQRWRRREQSPSHVWSTSSGSAPPPREVSLTGARGGAADV